MEFLSNRYNDLHRLLPIGGIRCWWLLVAIVLLSSLPAAATPVYDRVVQRMVPNSITLIGESHQRPQSAQFFKSLVDGYLQQHQCLTVALEIASSQQPVIDEMVQGRAVVSAVKIAPMIDHPPFRALIEDLARMRGNGACLELVAIDAGIKEDTSRDEWMAAKLAAQVGQAPVLVLLGNLHTLKKVDWHRTVTSASPYVAQILVSQGYHIHSYAQLWTDRECDSRNRFISADELEATQLINNKLMALLNAVETKQASDTIEGIILWDCGKI